LKEIEHELAEINQKIEGYLRELNLFREDEG